MVYLKAAFVMVHVHLFWLAWLLLSSWFVWSGLALLWCRHGWCRLRRCCAAWPGSYCRHECTEFLEERRSLRHLHQGELLMFDRYLECGCTLVVRLELLLWISFNCNWLTVSDDALCHSQSWWCLRKRELKEEINHFVERSEIMFCRWSVLIFELCCVMSTQQVFSFSWNYHFDWLILRPSLFYPSAPDFLSLGKLCGQYSSTRGSLCQWSQAVSSWSAQAQGTAHSRTLWERSRSRRRRVQVCVGVYACALHGVGCENRLQVAHSCMHTAMCMYF